MKVKDGYVERRQIEYFVAIIEHGGFTAAAHALRVAQPSLSRSVHNLERELGVTLFHRVGRKAVLSAAGEILAERARLILRAFETMRAAARAVEGGAAGRVDVAATSSSLLEPVSSVIADLGTRYPGVVVSTTLADSAAEVLAAVLQGSCEIGVCGSTTRPAGHGLVAHHMRDEEFLLVLQPTTDLPPGIRITPDILRGRRFVVTKPTTPARVLFDRLAATVDGMSIAAEVGDRSVLLPMVLKGIGAGFMPDGWADLAQRAGASVHRFDPPERLPQWLVHRRGPITAAAQAFVDTTLALTAPRH